MRNFYKTCLILPLFVFIITIELNAQINFTYQSQYKYLKGSEAAGLSASWMTTGFSDGGWNTGNAPFWYGDSTAAGTKLADMQNNYSTFYLRSTFSVSNLSSILNVSFTVDYDDGFVIWINGQEALRRNAPAVLAYNAFATASHESGIGEVINLIKSDAHLVNGLNTIAIQGFNVNLSSSDIYFDLTISASTNVPELIDTIGVGYNVPSGFYNTPFNLTLTSPNPTANVIYTLDGSNPQTSSTSYTGGTSVIIPINPASTTGRGTTPAVVVRASITKTGYNPSKPKTQTYIFVDKVKNQSYPGGDWPNTNVNNQIIYYKMDSAVVNDSRYVNQIDDALLAVPSISIVTDMKNLFDPAMGIYVNAYGHGLNWEKECSAELINPDGSVGFNIEAGLRIRGGWSRHENYPKHAFRLFFRSVYGKSKLNYPLFGDEGVSEFDDIDIRCEENYSYANGDGRNTCVRDVFSRDTQRDMGQPYTRSRYYNLYVDGMYWGLYQTEERAEASYGSDYLGGKKEDYDAVKVSTDNWSYTIEATDGNLNSWQKLYNMCLTGFTADSNYYKIEGKDANGKPVQGSEVMVDIDNLIDYMLVIFYTGNFDSPTSSFGSNKGCNNFNAIDDRNNKSKGFTFYIHDAEHCMFSDAASPGTGLYEDRVNLADRTDGMNMNVSSFSVFHPQWLHYKLSANAEYRMRFADRAFKQLNGEGVFTPSKVRQRLDKRVSEIETAIIAESARWGGISPWNGVPYTKDDNWLPEIQKIRNNYIPYRTNILINQLKVADLYSNLKPPTISKSGSALQVEKYPFKSGFNIVLANPNSSGSIYYTLDGSDPRLAGGKISPNATQLGSSATITVNNSTMIKTRIYDDGSWSALKHIDFLSQNEDYTNLKFTELNYHPLGSIEGVDTISGGDFEFIEFKNIGETSINLSGLMIDSAVRYTFPDYSILAPKNFWVVASKPSKFYDRYGMDPSGNYQGNLSNSGEYVLLTDSTGIPVISFTYDDHSPWPESADGDGYSLVSYIANPVTDPVSPSYWKASRLINGSPFSDDDAINGIEIHEFISDNSMMIYPNPTTESIVVNIKADESYVPIDIKLFNLNGMLVYQTSIENNSKINFKKIGLDAGMYIMHIESGNFLETAKIIYSPN